MKRAEDVYRGDRLRCQLWRNVVGDAGQTENLNVKRLTSLLNSFQVSAGVTSEA